MTSEETPDTPPIKVVLITGLSGAGRSTAARVLEDLGYYVVDNLPPALIPNIVDLGAVSARAISKLAIVTDVRSRTFFDRLDDVLKKVEDEGIRPTVVFLDATDDVLVRRYESVRRAHPLQGDGRIVDGIAEERGLLTSVRTAADVYLDTSNRSVHDLRRKLEETFDEDLSGPLKATVMSFGYKYGIPLDADVVFDARFLPNPHWVPELRPLTGQDKSVSDFVLGNDDARLALDQFEALIHTISSGYRREGKRYFTVAIGCTGGKHRSVAIAEEFARRLGSDDIQTRVDHRDVGNE
ncbi:UPF0042 nucleotide-binding protein [Antricoccus suffuscus]|uniref:UPF0042 nucleotide-binding protein n=1 Tax=Antricoccus suffuscus TaxID=1629062 RepID=A0A2T1A5V8_9ACTN|nr:RNase adapter RapZ [Antricoccus suffuscus]PRZ43718.1 UPF0042 nucleotide-binding protein [Antricoccus suffuscus]